MGGISLDLSKSDSKTKYRKPCHENDALLGGGGTLHSFGSGGVNAPKQQGEHCAVSGEHSRFEYFGVCCCCCRLSGHFEFCREVHSLCPHKPSFPGFAS